MIKLYSQNHTSIGHGGNEYKVVNGMVEVPDHVAPIAIQHGFSREPPQAAKKAKPAAAVADEEVSDPLAEQVATMKYADLLAYCSDNDIEVTGRPKAEVLRATVLAHMQKATAA